MSIEKQLAINRLKLKNVLLPLDVLNIIKSYAFEDKIIALTKMKKIKINKLIKGGTYLRFNNCESWDKQIGTLIFMGDNCSICGNYIDKSGIYTVTTTNEYGCVSRPSQALSVVFDTVFCIPIITLLPDSLTTQIYADSYNWYRNGTLLLSANNQKTIASPGPGTYTVQGYFTGRGLGTLSAPLIISGIEDKIKSSISIYPNPAQSQFSVAISTPTTIQIINCLGQILLTQKVNEGSTSISTAALPSGIYKVLADGFKSSSLVILK
jgi:hypothetical protein